VIERGFEPSRIVKALAPFLVCTLRLLLTDTLPLLNFSCGFGVDFSTEFKLNNKSTLFGSETMYSGTSVHELNPFLEAVREPKYS
jgi:hypothetical protein